MAHIEQLYNLIPLIYRQRDAAEGEPLRALVAVLESEYQTIEQGLEALYNNWFIETCQADLIPYIGDLVGLDQISAIPMLRERQRAWVANAIGLHRRKGTPASLEHAIYAATGWVARVLEFIRHEIRIRAFVEVDGLVVYAGLDSAFGTRATRERLQLYFRERLTLLETESSAAEDVVDIFLWRLQSYPVQHGEARALEVGYYTFNPFGLETPLFNHPLAQPALSHRVSERDVPAPLHQYVLFQEVQALRRGLQPETSFLTHDPVFQITVEDASGTQHSIPASHILVTDLVRGEPIPAALAQGAFSVAVSPEKGLLAFPPDTVPASVWVNYAYGFSADIGGGPYPRSTSSSPEPAPSLPWTAVVSKQTHTLNDHPHHTAFSSFIEALAAWEQADVDGEIHLLDSAIYDEGLAKGTVHIALGTKTLSIKAVPGTQPCVVGSFMFIGEEGAGLKISGLLFDGSISCQGAMHLSLSDLTLQPLRSASHDGLQASLYVIPESITGNVYVSIERCITGPLSLPSDTIHLTVEDSIIDGQGGTAIGERGIEALTQATGPVITIRRTTVLGRVYASRCVAASDAIFQGAVYVSDIEDGFIRFSYVPITSRTPSRFRCQPDLKLEAAQDPLAQKEALAATMVVFESEQFGQPTYSQLSVETAIGIREGAEDGSEMGAFHLLFQPQRFRLLNAIIADYLPYRLKASYFLIT